MSNFKIIRIIILLIILAVVWKHFDSQKLIAQNWNGTQDIVVIPINFDQQQNTETGIKRLKATQFDEINAFIAKQAAAYDLNLEHSVSITLGEPIDSIPPSTPKIGSSKWQIMQWVLKLRWWSFNNQPDSYHSGQIRLYIMYSSPEFGDRLPHSTGLQKGLIGLIHASAHKRDQKRNNMILTHELLHIFGASDKYHLATGHPQFPEGFANPAQNPIYPQSKAEIMAGRIPLSPEKFDRVYGLSQTVIGKKTAEEIGWLKAP